MSKQPFEARERQRLLLAKSQLVTPQSQDLRQLWLLVRQDPADGRQGCFFVTHGQNYDKFRTRKGFEVLAHGFDKVAMTVACRQATLSAGPSYQPPDSAHQRPLNQGPVVVQTEEASEASSLPPVDIADALDLDLSNPDGEIPSFGDPV